MNFEITPTEAETLIAKYDAIEHAHIRRSNYLERKAFSPVTHLRSNDPTRVTYADEIGFHVDGMGWGTAERVMATRLKGMTELEFTLFKKISSEVLALTTKLGCPTVPFGSLLRHIINFCPIWIAFWKLAPAQDT